MKKIIIGMASLVLFASCFENTEDLKNENRVFRTGDKYYVVYKGNTFELPKDLYLTENKKVEDYFTKGVLQKLKIEVLNKAELLNDLNKYFPNGIGYITENENISVNYQMPILNVGNEKHVDSIKFENILAGLPNNNNEKNLKPNTGTNIEENGAMTLKGKKIEILNANGIDGFAKKIGDLLKETFGLEYNAENYTKSETMNYIISKNLSENEIQTIIEKTGIKYVKIMEDNNIKPEADFVLITGNDEKIQFKLEIATLGTSSIVTDKIKEYNPEIVKSVTFAEEPIEKMEDIRVVYNKEDLYTAKIIAKKLGNNVKLVESDKMNNRIVVVSKN